MRLSGLSRDGRLTEPIAASSDSCPPAALFVVCASAQHRMLAWPGGGAANMEQPARLVSARIAIYMLPTQTLPRSSAGSRRSLARRKIHHHGGSR